MEKYIYRPVRFYLITFACTWFWWLFVILLNEGTWLYHYGIIETLKSKFGGVILIEPMIVTDKIGRSIVLRNAEEDDAASLIKFMKITTGETPFLIREPDEFSLTIEQEKTFIKEQKDNPRALMLIATVDEKHIGNCSLNGIGQYRRYAHRCEVAIALYQKYCGTGIGKLMLERILTIAKKAGYEQAELEVIATNEYAINLYRKLGFEEYGKFPNNMRYSDATYADALWMMKKL